MRPRGKTLPPSALPSNKTLLDSPSSVGPEPQELDNPPSQASSIFSFSSFENRPRGEGYFTTTNQSPIVSSEVDSPSALDLDRTSVDQNYTNDLSSRNNSDDEVHIAADKTPVDQNYTKDLSSRKNSDDEVHAAAMSDLDSFLEEERKYFKATGKLLSPSASQLGKKRMEESSIGK